MWFTCSAKVILRAFYEIKIVFSQCHDIFWRIIYFSTLKIGQLNLFLSVFSCCLYVMSSTHARFWPTLFKLVTIWATSRTDDCAVNGLARSVRCHLLPHHHASPYLLSNGVVQIICAWMKSWHKLWPSFVCMYAMVICQFKEINTFCVNCYEIWEDFWWNKLRTMIWTIFFFCGLIVDEVLKKRHNLIECSISNKWFIN